MPVSVVDTTTEEVASSTTKELAAICGCCIRNQSILVYATAQKLHKRIKTAALVSFVAQSRYDVTVMNKKTADCVSEGVTMAV